MDNVKPERSIKQIIASFDKFMSLSNKNINQL